MKRRDFTACLMLGAGALRAAEPLPPLPRPMPELAVNLPSGQQLLLSSLKGKVVLVEGLFTTCSHCQREAQLLSRLYTEYGPRGFQPVGVAFNDMAGMLVPEFIQTFKVNFPVGAVPRDTMAQFLGHNPIYQIYVPQVLLVDRKGMIRDQTPPKSDGRFQEEAQLRPMIENLLAERTASTPVSKQRPVPARRKTS